MANSKFVQAVKKAKGLYKTGRYKKFSDAVKAAYKKVGAPARKKRTVTRLKPVKRKRAAPTAKKPTASRRQQLESSLGSAYVRFWKASTIPATKKEQRRIAEIKRQIKKL